jgi:hypothetical protein
MSRKKGSVTTQDIDFSLAGEPDHGSISPFPTDTAAEVAQIAVGDAAVPAHEFVIYKLVNTKKKGRVHIDGIDDVINPATGKLERIILLSGAPSIWARDLVELLKDKDYVRQNRRSLTFENGVLRVPTWDTQALEWIKHCRHCIDNPSRRSGSKFEFFEYNPQKQQEAALKREWLSIDMAIAAKEMEEEKMTKLALYLGIGFNDELGRRKTPDGIRRELMLRAKQDPEKFQKLIGSREVEVAYLVTRAIIDAHLDLGGAGGTITWSSTGGFVCKVPLSRKPKEYLIELALSNSAEGRAFLDQLQHLIQ